MSGYSITIMVAPTKVGPSTGFQAGHAAFAIHTPTESYWVGFGPGTHKPATNGALVVQRTAPGQLPTDKAGQGMALGDNWATATYESGWSSYTLPASPAQASAALGKIIALEKDPPARYNAFGAAVSSDLGKVCTTLAIEIANTPGVDLGLPNYFLPGKLQTHLDAVTQALKSNPDAKHYETFTSPAFNGAPGVITPPMAMRIPIPEALRALQRDAPLSPDQVRERQTIPDGYNEPQVYKPRPPKTDIVPPTLGGDPPRSRKPAPGNLKNMSFDGDTPDPAELMQDAVLAPSGPSPASDLPSRSQQSQSQPDQNSSSNGAGRVGDQRADGRSTDQPNGIDRQSSDTSIQRLAQSDDDDTQRNSAGAESLDLLINNAMGRKNLAANGDAGIEQGGSPNARQTIAAVGDGEEELSEPQAADAELRKLVTQSIQKQQASAAYA